MESQKFEFFQESSKLNFDLVLTSLNHFSFVNISRTLVIDVSMERSSSTAPWKPKKSEFHKINVAKARKIRP